MEEFALMVAVNNRYDLILKGGHVIDPSQGINQVMDLGIKGGRITDLQRQLDPKNSVEVKEVTGKFVCPGLVDLHGHWYEGSIYGIDPHISLNRGVTTVVDAGTSGFINFPEFRKHTIDQAKIRILAFLHISCLGLHAPFTEELRDISYARPKETAVVIDKNRDIAVGVKIRQGSRLVLFPRLARSSTVTSSQIMKINPADPSKSLFKQVQVFGIWIFDASNRGRISKSRMDGLPIGEFDFLSRGSTRGIHRIAAEAFGEGGLRRK